MLEKKKRISNINLLRHQDKPFIDKLFDWAFGVGRGIVIITEVVALSAFGYRFILDRQIVDLTDSIKQKQAILTLSKNNEDKFRNLQLRLDKINGIEQVGTKKLTTLSDILETATGLASFTSIGITEDTITLVGVVPSISSLNTFAGRLNAVDGIEGVRIDKILASPGSGNIGFNISATIKK